MAIEPINYTGMQIQTDPAQALLAGTKAGFTLQQVQDANRQQQMAQQVAQQQRRDLAAIISNPNASAQDYAGYALKYPSYADAASKSFKMLNDQQQQDKLTQGAQVYGALQSGRPDLAQDILKTRVTALKNGGQTAEAANTQAYLDLINSNPDQAMHIAGLTLAAQMGPDKFSTAFPAIQKEARETAAAPLANAKTVAETKNLENQAETRTAELDIKREENRIKAMQVALGKEDNDLKRQELQGKIADAQQKRDQLLRDQKADVESGAASINGLLENVGKLENHPGFENLFGTTWKPGARFVAGTDAADANAILDTISSQASLAQLPLMKGTGAVTDKEEEILKNSLGSLSTKQSEKQIHETLATIRKTLTAARQRLGEKYGIQAPVSPSEKPLFQSKTGKPVTQAMIDQLAKQKGVGADVAERFFKEAY